jgi:Zn-finger nucleic acid-binding protein
MNCPVCNVNLTMTFRESVEIDYCPKCRGIWLDRGEIEKLIEKAGARDVSDDDVDDDDQRRSAPPGGYSRPPHRKRKGFLSEIFDWD